METRKVQLSGGTTFTVSLPKFWAEDHDIGAGSLVYLHPNEDGSLLIESAERFDESERGTQVDARTLEESEFRETILGLYLIGVDEIKIATSPGTFSDQARTVRDVVSDLTGFEIMETTEKSLVVRNLLDADNVSVRKSTVRLRLIVEGMHEDAITAVLENDEDLARDVISRDSEADKLFRLVTRYFQRTLSNLREVEKLSETRSRLFAYYYLARQFERVADHAEKIARVAIEQPYAPADDLGSDIAKVARDARSLVTQAAEPILSNTAVQVAYDTLEERDAILDRIETLHRSLYENDHPPEAYRWGLVLDSLRRTVEYAGNTAKLAIQNHLRESETTT